MGIYDTYGKVQLKINDDSFESFRTGDKANVPDGVYVGHEGIVVIHKGKFIAEFENITDKWGNVIKPAEITDINNPFNSIIERLSQKNEKKKG